MIKKLSPELPYKFKPRLKDAALSGRVGQQNVLRAMTNTGRATDGHVFFNLVEVSRPFTATVEFRRTELRSVKGDLGRAGPAIRQQAADPR